MIVTFENVIASEAYNCLFCHEVIYSACLVVEFDCENVMASEAYMRHVKGRREEPHIYHAFTEIGKQCI